jgi:phosphate transport system substrate-binding protein
MISIRLHGLALAMVAGLCATAPGVQAREQVRIVGSSTVFPFTTTVAEHFGRQGSFRTPIVEQTGTGAGMKIFCAGNTVKTPDIVNASRPIMPSEIAECRKNGVENIIETTIGFDGIVLANAKAAPSFALTRQELFLALARQVPENGKLVNNPYTRWRQINPDLPDLPIRVYGPPPTSGTRDAFVELVMEKTCSGIPEYKALSEDQRKAACHALREDGAYVEAGENDNIIVQRLQTNPDSLGIMGYSFLEENSDVVKAATIDGVAPDFDHIADGSYPVSRSLLLYTKKDHMPLVPGLKEFLLEYTSEDAMGEYGYLADKGLIPLLPELQQAQRSRVQMLETLKISPQQRQ